MKNAGTDVSAENEFDLDAINALPTFDPADYLKSEESIAAYLNDFLEEGDPAMIAEALGVAARARGMTEVAKEAGITREALYKALRSESSPRFETILRVMKAFGIRLVAQPIHPIPIPPLEAANDHRPGIAEGEIPSRA
jgi:probable addiction module antidote protein